MLTPATIACPGIRQTGRPGVRDTSGARNGDRTDPLRPRSSVVAAGRPSTGRSSCARRSWGSEIDQIAGGSLSSWSRGSRIEGRSLTSSVGHMASHRRLAPRLSIASSRRMARARSLSAKTDEVATPRITAFTLSQPEWRHPGQVKISRTPPTYTGYASKPQPGYVRRTGCILRLATGRAGRVRGTEVSSAKRLTSSFSVQPQTPGCRAGGGRSR